MNFFERVNTSVAVVKQTMTYLSDVPTRICDISDLTIVEQIGAFLVSPAHAMKVLKWRILPYLNQFSKDPKGFGYNPKGFGSLVGFG